MFTFPGITLKSSLFSITALLLIFSLLRSALRRLLAFTRGRHRNLGPRSSTCPQVEASRSETARPTPPHLASSVDDHNLIGGSHVYLSPPKGPTENNLTFCVFTPPSFDEEIPKIDLYGVLNFVRTGKVRNFAPRSSLRLLVINLREMTLAVYAPKKKKKKKQNKNPSTDGGKLYTGGINATRPMQKNNRRPSGINISTSGTGLMNIEYDVDGDDPEIVEIIKDVEDSWNVRHFESKPTMLHRLDDLVSVAAMPPRHGGVIEIISRLGTTHHRNSKGGGSLKDSERKQLQNAKPSGRKGNGRRPLSPRNQQSLRHGGLGESNKWQSQPDEINCRLDYVEIASTGSPAGIESEIGRTPASPKVKNGTPNVLTEYHRDEIAFRTPCDAAEFQRIVMILRTVGRETTYLYETLEAIASPEIRPHETQQSNEPTSVFDAPGAMLEDAWHCLKEMPSVRKCLHQFQLLSRLKDERDNIFTSSRNKILEATSDDNEMLPKGCGQSQCDQPTMLGLVDFFSCLFPPLPTNDPRVMPYFTPCAKTESIEFGRDADLHFRGIEWHYQRLCFASALQRRVSRAALYVRVYASARAISNDGWQLENGNERDSVNSQTSEGVTDRDECHNTSSESSPQDPGSQVISNDDEDDVKDSELGTISNSRLWSPPLINFDHQGYSCVGWYAFPSLPVNEHSKKGTDKSEVWLRPDADPLDCIPSLREVVQKYPYSHFFIFSSCSEKLGIAVYFLFVRSLPVGVDRVFDDTVHKFTCAKERRRDESLGIALQIGPGNDSSLATKLRFRAALVVWCHDFTRAAMKLHVREEYGSKVTLLSEFLSRNLLSLWHYGGSLQKRDDLPVNYAAINSRFSYNEISSRLAKRILGSFTINFSMKLKAFSQCLVPERAIMSIYMANIDLKNAITASRGKGEQRRNRTDGVVNTDHSPIDESEATAEEIGNPASNRHTQYHGTYGKNIDTIRELLNVMTVPSRKRSQTRGEHNQDNLGEIITTEQVPFRLTSSDIERYFIACEFDLKSTVVRIVESAAWRGIMFPVDRRFCRIEMQSAQFFQQGMDKESNPIFYFRNQLQAPWRNDVHATVLSVLDRLETYLLKSDRHRPNVKITLIAMGLDNEQVHSKTKKNGKNQDVSEGVQPSHPNQLPPSLISGSDPRIDPCEACHTHSNSALLQLLNDLIPRHYPGRLAKALVVPNKGTNSIVKTRLRSLLSSQFQSHITVLNSRNDLKKYVNEDQLVKFAGGNAKIASNAFQCGDSYNVDGT